MPAAPWNDLRLTQAAAVAAEHGCASAVDVESLVAEVRRLQSHAEELQFCLTQARIVLDHLSQTLPDQEDRRLAHGAMVASDMHLTDHTVHVRTHIAKHPLPGMRCDECPED